jgi:hypothetical protein
MPHSTIPLHQLHSSSGIAKVRQILCRWRQISGRTSGVDRVLDLAAKVVTIFDLGVLQDRRSAYGLFHAPRQCQHPVAWIIL